MADECRRDNGRQFVALADGRADLQNLAFIGDGAEGTIRHAHAAGDALIVINFGAAVVVAADCVDAAGLRAGAHLAYDGAVRANADAFPAFDALILVDMAVAVDQRDGVRRTDFDAGMREAALAHVRDSHRIDRAGVAGKFDDVDQRGV
jgi:hypothetical protein